MTEYHHLNNKQSGLPFILTQQSVSVWEMSMVNLVTCLFSLVLKHLIMFLKYNFFSSSRASFLHLIKDTDNM